jgi:hypothetical protein
MTAFDPKRTLRRSNRSLSLFVGQSSAAIAKAAFLGNSTRSSVRLHVFLDSVLFCVLAFRRSCRAGVFGMVARNIGLLSLLLLAASVAARAQEQGETPGALPNPGSYQGSMQLQREEQQRDMQIQQQNQAMQQRLDANYRGYAPGGGGMGGGGRAPAVNWFAKPALPPDRNPLLGRWRQTGSKAPRMGGALGQLSNGFLAGAMAGGCQSIFGKGVIAFEPNALQWVAPDGHEEILNHVGYRANGADVVIVTRDPGAVPALFFGFPNRDHAVVAVFGCTMERLGAQNRPAPPPSPSAMRMASAAPPPVSARGEARLNFLIAAAAPGRLAPFAGVKIWVTREDPTYALMQEGIPVRGDLATEIDSDCHDVTACMRDWKAMTKGALGLITSDAGGHARTPVMKPGRYFLVGVAPYQGRHLFWHRPIDVRAGSNDVTLDQTNASTIR